MGIRYANKPVGWNGPQSDRPFSFTYSGDYSKNWDAVFGNAEYDCGTVVTEFSESAEDDYKIGKAPTAHGIFGAFGFTCAMTAGLFIASFLGAVVFLALREVFE